MDNKGITKFLEANACRNKKETIKKLIKKFELDNKVAEQIYIAWECEYMKFKGNH
ncbi:MAG: hypothetical protein E6940_10570 [Clostridium septicum]|uniref:hypothetical protein n=1 Tax=Clostridium septicum TaxID=1504 RepID=UPI0025877AA5|nr:hypothetical protein [Clostridium septicum]MDU1314487.1 hypothetical protein [Clostridium septicum]